MQFDLSEEQRAISDMANSLFADFCSDQQLIDFTESGKSIMDDAHDLAKETGLTSLFVPESLDGSGLGILDLAIVLEAQGRHLAQIPLWRNQVSVKLLAKFCQQDIADILSSAAQAESLITCATAQDLQAQGARLVLNADGTLSGVNKAVGEAEHSDYALLYVHQTDTTTAAKLALVKLDQEGITLHHGRSTYGGSVSDVVCEAVAPVAVLEQDAVSYLSQLSIAALAALQVGLSGRQLERTVEYVSEREQFGRAIATFQAVQMAMADCKIALEALRSCLWQLCYRIDNGEVAIGEALATAYHACEAGHIISHKAQHVHGGFGVDISYPIYRYLYWSRDVRANLGGSQAILENLGNWLNDNEKLGWKYDLE